MPLTIRVGLSKKVGQANYGSFGASCQIDLELDAQQRQGKPLALQTKISEAFCLCKTAVESELALERQLRALDQQPEASLRRHPGTVAGVSRPRQTHHQTPSSQLALSQSGLSQSADQGKGGGQVKRAGQVSSELRGPVADKPVRQATVAQVKVLQRVADQLQIDLHRQAEQHFGVPTIEALTIRQASWLIDHLKAIPMPVPT